MNEWFPFSFLSMPRTLCLDSALNSTYPSFIKTLEKRQDSTLRGVTEKM